jgi:hypothetical protein
MPSLVATNARPCLLAWQQTRPPLQVDPCLLVLLVMCAALVGQHSNAVVLLLICWQLWLLVGLIPAHLAALLLAGCPGVAGVVLAHQAAAPHSSW